MVADGGAGEEGELGRELGEVGAEGKGADEGEMRGKVAPDFAGDLDLAIGGV